MEPSDPYRAPLSNIATAKKEGARTTRYLLATLAAVQLIVWLLSFHNLLDLTRIGAISPLSLLVCTLSAASLTIAGLLVLGDLRLSRWLYAAASIFTMAVVTSVPIPAVKTALFIALVSTATVWLIPQFRRGTA